MFSWVNTVTKYDVVTGKSQSLPDFPLKHCCLGCTKYQGNGVVAGRNKQVWVLKVVNGLWGNWQPLPDLIHSRYIAIFRIGSPQQFLSVQIFSSVSKFVFLMKIEI